ncbi:MAG: hypothetical protein V4450_02920 [Bacteroidota bacterium]
MKKIIFSILLMVIILSTLITSCTKYGNGFLSPFVTYSVQQFTFIRGRIALSNALVTDGSSTPMTASILHVYDSASGKVMDDVFFKKYQVNIWTAAYNPKTDTSYSQVLAKRGVDSLAPIEINANSGAISSTSASLYLPLGSYLIDLKVSNIVGSQVLSKIMKITIKDGAPLETTETYSGGLGGAFSAAAGPAGGSAFPIVFFNGNYNPFVDFSVTRFADTPNTVILKFTDRNGVPFNPRTGEVAKRPNSGVNPVPPFLQNLQDYAPDSYQVNDSTLSIKFALTPFPYASLGNGYNMYYDIQARSVSMDSSKAWTQTPAPGVFYKGVSDPAYLGTYLPGRYDYAIRVPMRVFAYGAYQINVRLLNTTHR